MGKNGKEIGILGDFISASIIAGIICFVCYGLPKTPSMPKETDKTLNQATNWLKDYYHYDRYNSRYPLYNGYSIPEYIKSDGELIITSTIPHYKAELLRESSWNRQIQEVTYLCPADFEDIWKFINPVNVSVSIYDASTDKIVHGADCSYKYHHVGKTMLKNGVTKNI